jgi:hypothetical protein
VRESSTISALMHGLAEVSTCCSFLFYVVHYGPVKGPVEPGPALTGFNARQSTPGDSDFVVKQIKADFILIRNPCENKLKI